MGCRWFAECLVGWLVRLLLGKLVVCGYVACVGLGIRLPPWLTCVGGFVAGVVVACLVLLDFYLVLLCLRCLKVCGFADLVV